ncbi:unnamed protein product [Caenorhabditis auriculariae]|uniref:Uncharacterized protein n=1 Tax=Caenorhabditis auriculariae TaxID=2777116 RepID=A0A8S1HJ55_9PELO|nr:unnamed protein product [Caenorhabditis auriculariae]
MNRSIDPLQKRDESATNTGKVRGRKRENSRRRRRRRIDVLADLAASKRVSGGSHRLRKCRNTQRQYAMPRQKGDRVSTPSAHTHNTQTEQPSAASDLRGSPYSRHAVLHVQNLFSCLTRTVRAKN